MYRKSKIKHLFWRPRVWIWAPRWKKYWFWIRIFITRGRGSGEGYVPKLTEFVRHLYATSQKWMIFEIEETAQYLWLKSENLSNWNRKVIEFSFIFLALEYFQKIPGIISLFFNVLSFMSSCSNYQLSNDQSQISKGCFEIYRKSIAFALSLSQDV